MKGSSPAAGLTSCTHVSSCTTARTGCCSPVTPPGAGLWSSGTPWTASPRQPQAAQDLAGPRPSQCLDKGLCKYCNDFTSKGSFHNPAHRKCQWASFVTDKCLLSEMLPESLGLNYGSFDPALMCLTHCELVKSKQVPITHILE